MVGTVGKCNCRSGSEKDTVPTNIGNITNEGTDTERYGNVKWPNFDKESILISTMMSKALVFKGGSPYIFLTYRYVPTLPSTKVPS